MKIIFFIASAFILLVGCKRKEVWTEDYRKAVKDSLNKVFKPSDLSNHERSIEFDCWITELAKSYPNGLPANGIPTDTLMKISGHCCIKCLKL